MTTDKDPGYDLLFVDKTDVLIFDNPIADLAATDSYYTLQEVLSFTQEFVMVEGNTISAITIWAAADSFGQSASFTLSITDASGTDRWITAIELTSTTLSALTYNLGLYLPPGRYTIKIAYIFGDNPVTWPPTVAFVDASAYVDPGYGNAGGYSDVTEHRLCFDLTTLDTSMAGDTLPLMLAEGGALAMQRSFSSPFSGQMAQGTLTEQDLSMYRARTQNDWTGGRALESATGQTDQYHDATDIDARFREMLVLAPRATKSAMPSSGPSFLPSDGATDTKSVNVVARNTTTTLDVPQFLDTTAGVIVSDDFGTDADGNARRVRSALEATEFVRYRPDDAVGQNQSSQRAYMTYTEGTPTYVQPDDGFFNTANINSVAAYAENNRRLAQSVCVNTYYEGNVYAKPRTLRHVQIYIKTIANGTSGIGTLEVRSDGISPNDVGINTGYPSNVILANGTFTLPAGNLQWVTVTLGNDVVMDDNTKYWIVLKTSNDGAKILWPTYGAYNYGKAEYSTNNGANWNDYYFAGSPDHRQHAHKLGDSVTYTNGVGRDVAQHILIGAEDVDADRVILRLEKTMWKGDFVAELELRDHLNGAPGNTILQHWNITSSMIPSTMDWVTFLMTETKLVKETDYWLILNVGSKQTDDGHDQADIKWGCDSYGKYTVEDSAAHFRNRAANTNSAWSAPLTDDLYFQVCNYARAQTRVAQSFTLGEDDVTLSRVQLLMRLPQMGDFDSNAGLLVRFYNDDADAPADEAALASAIITRQTLIDAGAVGNNAKWVSVPTVYNPVLTAETKYWMVIEPSIPTTEKMSVYVYNDKAQIYTLGMAQIADYTGGAWGDWETPLADIFFKINNGPQAVGAPRPYRVRLARSFITEAGDLLTVSKVAILGNLRLWVGAGTAQVNICPDNAGEPSADTVISNAAFDMAALPITQAWMRVDINAALDAETKYWIVVEASAPDQTDAVVIDWYGDNNDVDDLGGEGLYAVYNEEGVEEWSAWRESLDLYYIINDGDSFPDVVTVHPTVYDSELYVVCGLDVFKFDAYTQEWTLVETLTGTGEGTSMAEFGGKLYIARGDDEAMAIFDGDTWTTGEKYTYLLNYNGYLNAVKATGGEDAFGYYDGTEWITIDLATSAVNVTGLLGYRSKFLITTEIGIWEQSDDFTSQIMDYGQQRSAVNGRNPLVWIGDGLAYIPIRNGLHQWNLESMRPAGPDMGEGLPDGYQGPVSAMVGTPSWLFAAVDAGEEGMSAVYAKSADGGGWHKVMAAHLPGKRCYALAFEAVTHEDGIPRLWAVFGSEAWYIEMPDYTNNRYTYSGSEYQPEGHLISAWWGGELNQIPKDFQQIAVRSTGCRPGCDVDVYIEVDRSGYWMNCGTITRSPYQVLQLRSSAIYPKTIAVGSSDTDIAIDTDLSDLSDVSPGMFIRIGTEVGQVADVADSVVSLAMPLQNGIPEAGTKIYGSSPGGREMRYMLDFHTDTPDETPRVMSVTLRYQMQVLDDAKYTVTIRVEDNMRMRTGGEYPYTAAELREELDTWIRRLTPFEMVFPDGTRKRVKVMGASESDFTRDSQPMHTPTLKSRVTLSLMEV